MRCINFCIENKYDKFLNKIFENIDVKKYSWKIGYCEILFKNKSGTLNDTMFPTEKISGNDFEQYIKLENYYLIFADLKAFSSHNTKEINTIDDFLNSDCEIAFFCTDSIYVEIFVKNENIFEAVINNCRSYNFNNVEILSRENCGRMDFNL